MESRRTLSRRPSEIAAFTAHPGSSMCLQSRNLHPSARSNTSRNARSMPGSGLGLAIVSQCAEDNDGETFVRDNAGGGAVVGIRFR